MEHPTLKTPVLFLVSNRPAVAKIAFEAIRAVRPSTLYIVSDGPQHRSSIEVTKCMEVRSFVRDIDWDCKLKTLFREEHFGYGKGVWKGIDWFFDHEAEGIILEDDCFPNPTFFHFCAELLDRYRSDARVMEISGTNVLPSAKLGRYSYSFSAFAEHYGWASWRRAWKLYDYEMSIYKTIRKDIPLQYNSALERHYFDRVFERTYLLPEISWSNQWAFAKKINSGLTVIPQRNLVASLRNMDDLDKDETVLNRCETLSFPLAHPPIMMTDGDNDSRSFRLSKTTVSTRTRSVIRSQLPAWLSHLMLKTSILHFIKSNTNIPDIISALKTKSTY